MAAVFCIGATVTYYSRKSQFLENFQQGFTNQGLLNKDLIFLAKLYIAFISEENCKCLKKRKFTGKEPRKRRKYLGKRNSTAEKNKSVNVAANCTGSFAKF